MSGNGHIVSYRDAGRVIAAMQHREHPATWSAYALARMLELSLDEASNLVDRMSADGLLTESSSGGRRVWRLNPNPKRRRRKKK